MSIEKLVREVCSSTQLPEHYKGDVDADIKMLQDVTYAVRFVWLLRTSGTVLMPVKAGIDPMHIMYWADNTDQHGQEVKAFLIDTEKVTIKPITNEQAVGLAQVLPDNLSLAFTPSGVEEKVNAVLECGCANRLWGFFKSPESINDFSTWEDWLDYFKYNGNTVMAKFMLKAIETYKYKERDAA